jgi:hypothetical protein
MALEMSVGSDLLVRTALGTMLANTTGRFLVIQRALAVAGYEEVLGLQNSILVNKQRPETESPS